MVYANFLLYYLILIIIYKSNFLLNNKSLPRGHNIQYTEVDKLVINDQQYQG